MAKFDGEEALFSIKCFIAAMLAYLIALQIGLERPDWAVATAFIASQPLAGATLSKALFRLIGTLLGAAVVVLLVPTFADEPLVLAAALALWLASCTAIALLDRTPRAYIFLLAGYTASIIGFPSVDTPGDIFGVAVLRVQEITIGIIASSLVHGVIFPRMVTGRLLVSSEKILADAERWTGEALSPSTRPEGGEERRRIAIDLSELDQLAVQLPFDTARLVPRTRTVRAFQDRLLELLPLVGTVGSRLAELAATGGVPPEIGRIALETQAWLLDGVHRADRDASAAALIIKLESMSAASAIAHWRDMLALNLCARLADLIKIHSDARDLSDQLRSPGLSIVSPRVAELLAQRHGRSIHRDPGLALRAALGTFVCVMLGCVLWIALAWPNGANALLIAAVCCSLFANVDRPGPVILRYLAGATIGVTLAMVYAAAILPRITTFETLAATIAPPLLLVGALLARPKLIFPAYGGLIGFVNSGHFHATYNGDFVSFANGAIALLFGIAFACVSTRLFQTVGANAGIARLFRAAWRDVARRAMGRGGEERRWASRMLDRVGLIVPRLASRQEGAGGDMLDALTALRIGLVAGRLRELSATSTGDERVAIGTILDGITRYFRSLHDPTAPIVPPATLLDHLDQGFNAFAADPQPLRARQGLIHLTSLRRNLFPTAAGWAA